MCGCGTCRLEYYANFSKHCICLKNRKNPGKLIQPDCDMFAHLHTYMKEGKFTDVYLMTGDDAIGAHKAVLASSSKVFKAMFESEMKESLTQEVVIPDVDADALRAFLDYVYTKDDDIVGKHLEQLFMLADKYDVEPLLDSCDSYIRESLDVSNALEYLQLSDLYSREDLKKSLIDFIKSNFSAVIETGEWLSLKTQNPRLASAVVHSMMDERYRAGSFMETDETFCDAVIKIDDGSINVHKFILMEKSAEFSEIFKDDPKVGRIKGISEMEFYELMDYVYFNKLPSLKSPAVLKAAVDFGLGELANHEVSLYMQSLSWSTAIDMVIIANSLKIDALKALAMEVLLNHFDQVRKSESWDHLFSHPDLMIEIFSKTQ